MTVPKTRCILYIIMTMKRSQIYLPLEQWRLLSILSDQSHESISELIRKSIDSTYKRGKSVDFGKALAASFGIWKDRKDLPSTETYIRRLRRDRRLRSRRA